MDLSLRYKMMCQQATEIQKTWLDSKAKDGDWFIAKAGYCGKCTDENPCRSCLDMSNVYVVSGTNFNREFFFYGHYCNRTGGCLLDETASEIFLADSEKVNHPEHSPFTHFQSEFLWLPRIDQLQQILRKHFVDCTRENLRILFHQFDVEKPVEWQSWTDEMLWLALVMKQTHRKTWNGKSWAV
jgi:hypothetical protein